MKITSAACLLVAAFGVAMGAVPSREQITFDLGQLSLTAVTSLGARGPDLGLGQVNAIRDAC